MTPGREKRGFSLAGLSGEDFALNSLARETQPIALTDIPPATDPPLGVYIHWPYCARICPYCDFNVVRDRGRADEQGALVDAIATDLTSHAARIGPRRLVSIFLGGGTPSLLRPDWAARLIALAKSLWPAEADLEVTLEANPTDAESARFAALAAAGVNRLSLGVQALDDPTLKFLGRNHDAASGLAAVGIAVRTFARVSLDLIYAVPGQDETSWLRSLDAAVAQGAEHISAYQLTVEPGTPFDRAVRKGRFRPADSERAASLYEATQRRLEALGLAAYEVSNHARDDRARSRHNLIYWRGDDYVGVGPGAHGRLSRPGARLATQAERGVGAYIAAVARTGVGWCATERLDAHAHAQERLLMGLRIAEGVPLADLAALGPMPATAALIHAGLVRVETSRLQATARGRLVLDRLTAELLG